MNGEPLHRRAFLPFGAGPRRCLGEQFAEIQATLVIRSIIDRYNVSIADTGTKVDFGPLDTFTVEFSEK